MSSSSSLDKITHRYEIVNTNIKWFEQRVNNGPYTDYYTFCEKCKLQQR